MENIIGIDTISRCNVHSNNEMLHPLVNIIDMSKADIRTKRRINYGCRPHRCLNLPAWAYLVHTINTYCKKLTL